MFGGNLEGEITDGNRRHFILAGFYCVYFPAVRVPDSPCLVAARHSTWRPREVIGLLGVLHESLDDAKQGVLELIEAHLTKLEPARPRA